MEPRELWERNLLLAEAFCGTDDRVRQAQAVMDEALASRTRTLAAFAVTVGSDAAVASLMGLNEREVRVARRTVGREDARVVADALLKQLAAVTPPPAEVPPPPAEVPPPPADAPPQPLAPDPDPAGEAPAEAARAHVPHPRAEAEPYAHPVARETAAPAATTWTEGMDSVLLWSWQSGLDLQIVAEELGLDAKELLLRAQKLAAEGQLTPRTPAYMDVRAGRHRRHDPVQYTFVPDSPETLYSSPHSYG
ncbi:hypothetical protein SLNWT_3270 [Streptomyces albus]|uniref:Uncharacterized protein n=1 Tax=Streptomyces albus (strain ATCC 21838 / DSM 41398 / FERM P-419 / JCM 4703 / NBRC 107858) TaxID=1081613 RepID=A0A0B5EYD2_STRA4|nr:hypothetical protein SLNWT_3270 [Streptomyces albus]AOU77954.1 hypothetical protein SLNHY_3263 [Streptomyces albus]AYN33710.1 hypothetical protein DUI70_3209 [Streptomyces albus]